ncbi:hypothetical protein CIW49_03425 [Mycolicibacterium sp. P1-18]|uniref:hypothetical protein n=1 Tax=Mycolicibacterium sp. P1-18 TaxID=2024615 RepID=UPI0011F0ADBE|nr:hypothetical protein [Mycolicibacterium sp. P1-18]KAA0102369.1 hypothetical protein CIW49_03425 [Mycolicibacterium sp. P1-18]
MPAPVPMSEVAVGGWVFTVASLLALLAAGVAVRTGRRLLRRSTPELVVLLNESAAFYSRWPEDRLWAAPSAELAAEVARCRRVVELLESRHVAATGASRGAVDGLNAWIALLGKRIDKPVNLPSGAAYA